MGMKHLTTLLALLLSCSMLGQNFPVPYNPDDDANGLIGTPDLLSLLALFGEEFSAAVVSEDDQSVIRLSPKQVFFVLCEPKEHSERKLCDVLGLGGFHLDELKILCRPNLGH